MNQHIKYYQITLFLLIALYGVFIALASIQDFPSSLKTDSWMPYLLDKPVGEDGFYMLMVSWNLAEGNGLVGNFDLNVTGIQPLATFIYAALAFLVQAFDGDKFDFVRVVILFGTLNIIFFASLMGAITKRLIGDDKSNYFAPFFAVLISCSSFNIFRTFTYGLETGIYLTVFSLLLLQYYNIKQECDRQNSKTFISKNIVLFGVLVGLVGLARIDFGIVYAVFLIRNVLMNRSSVFPWAVSGLIGALIVSTWLIYVYAVTGSPIPSSGPAQASLVSLNDIEVRALAMLFAVIQNLTPTIFIGNKWYLEAAASILIFVLIYVGIRQRIFSRLGFLNDWITPVIILIPIYFSFFWAAHFYSRYTALLMVLGIPFLSIAISINLKSTKFEYIPKTASFLLLGIFFTFCFMSLHRGKVGNSHSVTAGFIYNQMPSEIVGAFQSGVIGFANSNTINLDGKVNFDVLPHVESGNIDLYLKDNSQIKVIVDWPGYIENHVSADYLVKSWVMCIDGSSWGSVGYCRRN